MKVLWFANTPCGATEKLSGQDVTGGGWLYALSETLKNKKNVELHIAFYWGEEMEPFLYEGIYYHPVLRNGYGNKLGRYIYRLKQQFFNSSLDDIEVHRLLNTIKSVNPDIIHIHGSEENFGLVGQYLNKSVPIVLSVQGMLSPCSYKLYSGFSRESVLKNESIISKICLDGYSAQERKMKIRVNREKIIYKTINNIIGRTSWDNDCTLALNANRNYFICNEILRDQFMISNWEAPSADSKIVLTTTISYGLYKGLEMIYETSRVLHAQDIDFEWNVIGIAKGDKYDVITRKITGIKPEDHKIKLLGRKNADEMLEIFNQSNIYIQVSHIENSPNSLCEAMVIGMPIIASYAGGTSSMLKDGKEGILVQDGDPYRLAGAIINMCRDYKRAIELGRNARDRALVRHNPGNVVGELLEIYKTITEIHSCLT